MRKEGGGDDGLQPKGPFSKSPSPGISKCAAGNRCQISNSPSLNVGKPLFKKRGFSMASAHQSSVSSSFLPSLSGAGGRNVTQHSIVTIRAKEKNLVSTLQCHPQQDRQNITKNQYSRKLSSNVFCLVWLLSPSVVNRFFF